MPSDKERLDWILAKAAWLRDGLDDDYSTWEFTVPQVFKSARINRNDIDAAIKAERPTRRKKADGR